MYNFSVTQELHLAKLKYLSSKEICNLFKIHTDDVNVLVAKYDNPSVFLLNLIKNNLFIDAVNFLLHGLPKREAIWWGYICTKQAVQNNNTAAASNELLELIKAWFFKPDDSIRRQIDAVTLQAEFNIAPTWLAKAVFWSGGSITQIDGPQVMPQEFLYAKALAGAIILAAVLDSPNKADLNYQHFLAQGINIANGGNGEI